MPYEPAECQPQPRLWFHWSPTHEEALSRLEFCVDRGEPVSLLQGPAGSGKTRLVEQYADRLRRAGRELVVVAATGLSRSELDLALGQRLAAPNPSDPWSELAARRLAEMPLVVVVDDVDPDDRETLTWLRRLARLPRLGNGRALVSLVVVGAERVAESELFDGCLRNVLEPLQGGDCRAFVDALLADRFNLGESAAAAFEECSDGLPGRLRSLVDVTVAAAESRGTRRIESHHVRGAATELGLNAAAEPALALRA